MLPDTYDDKIREHGVTTTYRLATIDQSGNISNNTRNLFIPAQSTGGVNIKVENRAQGIQLSWQLLPNETVTKTVIYRSSDTEKPVIYATLEGDATVFIDSGVTNNTQYTYFVRYYDNNGNVKASAPQKIVYQTH